MTPHEVLLDPNSFFLLWEGLKNVFAIYDFQGKYSIDDKIIIKEYNQLKREIGSREIRARIFHVYRNARGAPANYVVIQIMDIIHYSPEDGETL
jgi:formylmethanofuran dehydrogenase subunit A